MRAPRIGPTDGAFRTCCFLRALRRRTKKNANHANENQGNCEQCGCLPRHMQANATVKAGSALPTAVPGMPAKRRLRNGVCTSGEPVRFRLAAVAPARTEW